jgi:hypothetical protein
MSTDSIRSSHARFAGAKMLDALRHFFSSQPRDRRRSA